MRLQRKHPKITAFASTEAFHTWLEQWREAYEGLSAAIHNGRMDVVQLSRHSLYSANYAQSLVTRFSMIANQMMLDRDEVKLLSVAHSLAKHEANLAMKNAKQPGEALSPKEAQP